MSKARTPRAFCLEAENTTSCIQIRLIRENVVLLEPGEEVVGVKDGIFTYLPHSGSAEKPDVGVGPEDDPEVAVESAYLADGLGRPSKLVLGAGGAGRGLVYDGCGQEVGEGLGGAYGPCTRASATVRGAESLVQVGVDDVEAQVTEADPAEDGVEVSAVAVDHGADIVEGVADFEDAWIEESEGAGKGEHESGGL